MLGQRYAALLLAEILPESELEQKEALYKQAIENGLDGALALYVSFLMKTKGYDEAHEYEEFMDVSDLSETDLETSEESSGPEAVFEQFPREENKEVVEKEEKTPSLTLPTSSTEGEANVFYYGQYEQKEKFQTPSLSKRTLREIERAKKKQSQPSFSSSAEKTSYRTFRDITVLVDPDAESEVKACSYKVKNLLSSLANGEGRRGNLKLLQGQDDLYSMRITRSDRLVLRILEGNLKTGIKRLQILCAKGHYSALSGARLSRDEKSCERL